LSGEEEEEEEEAVIEDPSFLLPAAEGLLGKAGSLWKIEEVSIDDPSSSVIQ